MRELGLAVFLLVVGAGITQVWAYSSVGQSARLISVRSVVQLYLGPP